MNETNGSESGRWERADAPLGTLVYRAGLLSKEKLESALQEGEQSGRRLGEVLLQKGWLDEKDLARLLAGQKGLPFVSLRGRGFDPDTVRLLSEQVCRFHNAMPVEFEDGTLLVAIADPTDETAVAEIQGALARSFRLVVATAAEIRAALDDVFGARSAPGASSPEPTGGSLAAPPATALRVAPPAGPSPEEPAASPETPSPPPPDEPAPPAPVVDLPAPAPQPLAPLTPEPDADPPAAEAPPLVEAPPPAVERPAPAVASSPSEPTIRRIEDEHVSVAFHSPIAHMTAGTPSSTPPQQPDAVSAVPPVAPAPAPVPPAAPAAPPPEASARFGLVLSLENGDEIEMEPFGAHAEVEAAAHDLAAQLARRERWPRVGPRFIRPDRIVSIEIRER